MQITYYSYIVPLMDDWDANLPFLNYGEFIMKSLILLLCLGTFASLTYARDKAEGEALGL